MSQRVVNRAPERASYQGDGRNHPSVKSQWP
jgi:hypothetical protein